MQSLGQNKSPQRGLTFCSERKLTIGTFPCLLLSFLLRGSGRHGGSFNITLESLKRRKAKKAEAPLFQEFKIQPGTREETQVKAGAFCISFNCFIGFITGKSHLPPKIVTRIKELGR